MASCDQDSSSLYYYKMNTWCDFLAIKCDKASKLYSVRCNQKLLFTDPGPLRKDIWDYFIPEEFCEIKSQEYRTNCTKLEEIVLFHFYSGKRFGPSCLCTHCCSCQLCLRMLRNN